jgi:hypothetical protein
MDNGAGRRFPYTLSQRHPAGMDKRPLSIMRGDAGADIDQCNRGFPPFFLANKGACT